MERTSRPLSVEAPMDALSSSLSGCFHLEILEILNRDPRALATARDLPRLMKRIRVEDAGEVLWDGKGQIAELLDVIGRVCHEEIPTAVEGELLFGCLMHSVLPQRRRRVTP